MAKVGQCAAWFSSLGRPTAVHRSLAADARTARSSPAFGSRAALAALGALAALVGAASCGGTKSMAHGIATSGPSTASSTSSASGASGASGAGSASGSASPNDAEHEAAVARLAEAPWGMRIDKRRTLAVPLPDGGSWTHVKFWGVTTLAGFRYGDAHHAVAAAFSFASTKSEATVESCSRRFLAWGRSRAKAFDLDIGEPRIDVVPWIGAASVNAQVRIYVLDAERRSVFGVSRYPSAFAVYPAWKDACLVIGVSVPGDDAPLADVVRDRLVRDALPAVVTKAGQGKLALEAAIDVDE